MFISAYRPQGASSSRLQLKQNSELLFEKRVLLDCKEQNVSIAA